MSVLKSKRKESTAEYVNLSMKIFSGTLHFLAKLSNRYQRIFVEKVSGLAADTMNFAEKANNIRVTDDVTYSLRKGYLNQARASVMALDVNMSYIWQILMQNPQGCFTNTKGVTVSSQKAVEILNKMADELGCQIDEFKNKVTKILDSDRERYQKMKK